MTVEFAGRRYEVLLASDVVDDGVALEMSDVTDASPELVLFAFYSDADGEMTFSAFREELPFEAVEWFVGEARRRLPPAAGQAR